MVRYTVLRLPEDPAERQEVYRDYLYYRGLEEILKRLSIDTELNILMMADWFKAFYRKMQKELFHEKLETAAQTIFEDALKKSLGFAQIDKALLYLPFQLVEAPMRRTRSTARFANVILYKMIKHRHIHYSPPESRQSARYTEAWLELEQKYPPGAE